MFKKLLSIAAMALVGVSFANAETVTVATVDYSTMTEFPYYVMGYTPTFEDGVMKASNPGGWYQFFMADQLTTEINGNYTVTVKVKSSKEGSLDMNMGWGWGAGQSRSGKLNVTTEWTESSVEYISVQGTSVNVVLQPGSFDGELEFEWLKLTYDTENATTEISENTVWVGKKECDYGNGVFVDKAMFANARPGDKVVFFAEGRGWQSLLGGWSGLNRPAYENNPETVYDDAAGTFTVTFPREYAFDTQYGDNTLNVINLIKNNGVGMHGKTTITRIDYIPANYVTVDEVLDQPMGEAFWVEAPIKVEEALLTGHLILTDGEKYILGGAFTDEAYALQSGDVIGAYWTVQNAELVGVCDFAIDNTVEIESPVLVENKYGEHASAIKHGNYHKLTDVKYDGENIENTEEILFDAHEVLVGKSAGVYTLTGVWINLGGSATTDDDDLGDDFNTPSGYVFVITAAKRTGDLPTTGINAIESENAAAVYYNMQGVRVANPAQGGVYIVKQGNKISKKIIK